MVRLSQRAPENSLRNQSTPAPPGYLARLPARHPVAPEVHPPTGGDWILPAAVFSTLHTSDSSVEFRVVHGNLRHLRRLGPLRGSPVATRSVQHDR